MQTILNLIFIIYVVISVYAGSILITDYNNLKESTQKLYRSVSILKDTVVTITENEVINTGLEESQNENIRILIVNQETLKSALNAIIRFGDNKNLATDPNTTK